MPITAANLTASGDTTDGTSYTTASISPAANTLILAFINNIDLTTAGTVTLSGNSLTWVEVDTRTFGGENRQTVFRAMGSSPSSGAVTITITGAVSNLLCTWTIDQLSGTDTSGTNGSGAIVQFLSDGVFPATTLTITLAAFSDTANATHGFWYQNGDTGMTAGSGFTELSDTSINDAVLGLRGVMSEFRSDNDTTVDASRATSAGIVGYGIEIKASALSVAQTIPGIEQLRESGGFIGQRWV